MAYGNLLTDVVQSSTTNTPPVFKDGNGTETGQLCRAWANFGYTGGAMVIAAAFNVSSVTRSSTGVYVVNFTNAMPDTKYSVTGLNSTTQANAINDMGTNISTYTTNSFTAFSGSGYKSGSTYGTAEDSALNIAVFR